MIFIAHRGNLVQSEPENENKPSYIRNALSEGFDVETDVWFINNVFCLGHDRPLYEVSKEFLKIKKIWCHAKNVEALIQLKKIRAHYFWHQTDAFTLTSKNYIWTYPGEILTEESIAVMPETVEKYKTDELKKIKGICSNIIRRYRDDFKKS